MRILAVSGKGGVGKTMLSALIIRKLVKDGERNILAIDADPDFNLPGMLGVSVKNTVGDIKEELLTKQSQLPPGYSKDTWLESRVFEIIVETPDFDILVMGRPEGPGCYCSVNNVLRWVIDSMTKSYDHVIIDAEAGLEHISRKTTMGVDDMIIVTDMSQHGFDTAKRINELAGELGARFKHLYLVANRVNAEHERAVTERAESLGPEFLGMIPYDICIEEYLFAGRSLLDLEECSATKAVEAIMDKLS